MTSTASQGAPRAAGGDTGPTRAEAALPVVDLSSSRAREASLAGGKAAALATATTAGLPVLPGFVVTTEAVTTIDRSGAVAAIAGDVEPAWRSLSDSGRIPLVVRSSSTVEDLADSSMAGRFRSVVGVDSWEAFLEAVAEVLASRAEAAEAGDVSADQPLAVVVQPMLEAAAGGVLFGVDPVTGREDRIVVAAVEGQPDRLVSGEVDGSRFELDRRGRVVAHERGAGGADLSRRVRRRLVDLAARTAAVFGGPQDLEWGLRRDGDVVLLQSRPVTTPCRGIPEGPVLGRGPVAETFPDRLSPLEQALWVEPLRRALREVFLLTGTTSRRQVERSPLATVVDGWVAADLDLFEGTGRGGLVGVLDPRPRVRRLAAAWRVGRLRAALPRLAEDVLEQLDRQLASVPDPATLSDRQLVALLERARQALTAVHGHQVLLGLVVAPETSGLTGTGVALRTLAAERADGRSDADIVRLHPVVLALTAAHVGPPAPLPQVDAVLDAPASEADRAAVLREALRLRVRWLQEATASAAWELGRRWAEAETLARAEDVRALGWDELCAVAAGAAAPTPPSAAAGDRTTAPPPARFRLGTTGAPIPVVDGGGGRDGAGAGGGVATGPVHQGDGLPPEGSVLVVGNLEPSLAPLLPRISGLVAETGSVLAHAAILAREANVPTVVGVPQALERFPAGRSVRVDGTAGTVELVGEESPDVGSAERKP